MMLEEEKQKKMRQNTVLENPSGAVPYLVPSVVSAAALEELCLHPFLLLWPAIWTGASV
jgi:hypothetical protein